MIFFRQCRMSKPGFQDEVAWIPEKFAVKGKVIKLKEDDGWTVDHAGTMRKTNEEMQRIRDEHRTHRQQTDV